MKKCKICNKEFKNLGQHIRQIHKEICAKDYYDKYIEPDIIHICENPKCNNPTKFDSLWRGYLKTCSSKCYYQLLNYNANEYKQNIIDPETGLTLSKKLAIERRAKQLKQQRKINPKTGETYLSEISRKIFYSMSEESRNNFINNGNTKYFDRLKKEGKFKEHQIKVSNNFWGNFTEKEKSKYIQSNLDKMVKQRKSIIINDIKITNLQGYEDIAILYLINKEKIDINKIIVKPKYIRLLDNHIYYPDFKIDNTIIEIKSEYTFSLDKKLNLKIKSVLQQGFNFRLMIFNSSHLLKDLFYNSL